MPRYSINNQRLNQTLQELGHLGESPTGMDRVAYSPEDILGRNYSIKLMQEAGLKTRIDTAGNIIGRRTGLPILPHTSNVCRLCTENKNLKVSYLDISQVHVYLLQFSCYHLV